MLEALKLLESRNPPGTGFDLAPPQASVAKTLPAPQRLVGVRHVPGADKDLPVGVPVALPHQAPLPSAPFEKCTLPTTNEVPGYYLELASRIGEQVASNYCNALLFVSPDHSAQPCFSMTTLAQALASQSPGDVLLVDGDLRYGRLSRSVSTPGPGMIEVMLGLSHWPDVIHPTNAARIDFVGCGHSQVPTFDRPEFGWGALRPMYRAVLIGLSVASEPEINWLAARCDGVYFVISRPHTKRQAASSAVNTLRSCGASVLGCVVVND
jgi:hypothetical protein